MCLIAYVFGRAVEFAGYLIEVAQSGFQFLAVRRIYFFQDNAENSVVSTVPCGGADCPVAVTAHLPPTVGRLHHGSRILIAVTRFTPIAVDAVMAAEAVQF